MASLPPIPIFSCSGNRTVAVNPAAVRSVEADEAGRVKIVFDREHELMVKGTLLDVMKAIWKPLPNAEIDGVLMEQP